MHLESRIIDVSNFSVSKSTSSKGNQRKWTDGKLWVKAAFEYEGRFWQDYLVEIIAAEIGDQLHFNVIQQGLAAIQLNDDRERLGCWSNDFLPAGFSFLLFYHLLRVHNLVRAFDKETEQKPPETVFVVTRRVIQDITGFDPVRYLTEMVVLDYLIGNEDRHLNNFGVLWNAEQNSYQPAPLFDNGLGLFEHDPIYAELSLTQAVRKMKGKPFSRNLEKAVDAIDIRPLELSGKVIDTTGLTFPNQLAKAYLKHAAEHLGIEVL